MKNNNPILLIDGTFFLYRSYYGIPKSKNSFNTSTNAIYGFLKTIKKLLIQYNSKKIVIIFDSKGKTFRNKLFKKYKANRRIMPEDLINQIKPLYKIIKFLGLYILHIKGFEADDIIGTVAKKINKTNNSVLIATGDKDMLQLVTSKVKIINIKSNNIIDTKEIKDKYGFNPKLIIDFIALMGDRCDNIPGIFGIGKKTAQLLIKEIGSLNQIYNNLDKIHALKIRGYKSITEKLIKNKELAFISYKLATINTDIKINFIIENITINKPNEKELLKIFKKYKFTSWITCLKNYGKNFLFQC